MDMGERIWMRESNAQARVERGLRSTKPTTCQSATARPTRTDDGELASLDQGADVGVRLQGVDLYHTLGWFWGKGLI